MTTTVLKQGFNCYKEKSREVCNKSPKQMCPVASGDTLSQDSRQDSAPVTGDQIPSPPSCPRCQREPKAMANPRRSSGLHFQNLAAEQAPQPPQPPASSPLASVVVFLKRPHAFPFLLSVFILLTWVSLRFQQPHPPYNSKPSTFATTTSSSASSSSSSRVQSQASDLNDAEANVVRFSSVEFPSQILKDKRGWLLNPVDAALDAGISGARSCASVHVGEIRPGGVRGNHRHHTCNETFIIWGAMTKFRLENPHIGEKGFAESTIGADEVALAASPSGTAHALVNIDPVRTTFFLGCQDDLIDYNSSTTDFNVWKDL